MKKKSPASEILKGVKALPETTQATILANAKSNIERGFGNWVDALIVAANAGK